MRFALCIEYDGSHFHGWQAQLHARSVQQDLESALAKVANHCLRVVCAGRTDTGVHALGQVVHFDSNAEREERSWLLGGNVNLPRDISIAWVKRAHKNFHARFSAVSRRYRYVIVNRETRFSLLDQKVTWIRQALDVRKMDSAAQFLVGEHDFSSFRASQCQAKHPVRTVHSISVSRSAEFIYLDIIANAFLHHMVRNIAGVLISIGKGERSISWVFELLRLRDRRAGGVTAPPDGLYLIGVGYPKKYEIPVSGKTVVFG
jgi:tRNA pseudouridine38-40 synthase